jgi:hypothetical protein
MNGWRRRMSKLEKRRMGEQENWKLQIKDKRQKEKDKNKSRRKPND